jgi:putative sterol carrier protein
MIPLSDREKMHFGENMSDSIESIFEKIPHKVDEQKISDLTAVFQFFIGKQSWFVDVNRGSVSCSEGEHDDYNVSFTCTDKIFWRLVGGDLSATSAWMGGRVKVRGNMMLANKVADLFPN